MRIDSVPPLLTVTSPRYRLGRGALWGGGGGPPYEGTGKNYQLPGPVKSNSELNCSKPILVESNLHVRLPAISDHPSKTP